MSSDLTQSIETDCGVETVFCKYYEADTGLWIESKQFIDEGTSSVTVVTSDNEVRGLCSPNAHCQYESSARLDFCVTRCIGVRNLSLES